MFDVCKEMVCMDMSTCGGKKARHNCEIDMTIPGFVSTSVVLISTCMFS